MKSEDSSIGRVAAMASRADNPVIMSRVQADACLKTTGRRRLRDDGRHIQAASPDSTSMMDAVSTLYRLLTLITFAGNSPRATRS
jgi:hypothetical protein